MRRAAFAGAAILGILCAALVVAHAVPLPARLSARPSTVIRFRDGSPAHVFLSPDDRFRIAARLDRVDPDHVAALVRYEDKRFFLHPGVDPIAVARAAVLNARRGRVSSGGSTITMQLVRVLEPRPRTLRSKAIEALRAMQLEARLSKEEILEAYLTFAPYGRNVEGVEAASLAYFGHGAADLSPSEIAILLAVPQRPSERYPCEANAERLRASRSEIARRLAGEGVPAFLDASADSAPVPAALRPMPRGIAHAARRLKDARPGESEIVTTLDRSAQALAENRLLRARTELAASGIHDATVVVVQHATGDVRALVGNFDFHDPRPGSQVAGFDVARSPGSTLKPFLHALAIDEGLALPDTLVPDVPVSHGSYSPENNARTFAGLVTLRSALAWSLNVPFVNLLARTGVERFIGLLRAGGAESLSPTPGAYGLAAAVGGVEVTPLEVAALYAALAGDGRVRRLRLVAGDPDPVPSPLLSAGAAWMTRSVLAARDRPDFPMRRQFSAAPSRVHWKTGTSQGHLDAWACGSGPGYTAVVWLGNFDRSPSAALVGSDASAPLLFDVLEGLADRSRFPAPDPVPPGLATIELCAYSGRLPSEACPARRRALAVRDSVPAGTCDFHVAIDVDLDTGLALNPSCRTGRRWERRTFLTWPATVRRHLSAQERDVPRSPSLLPGCEAAGTSAPPAIVSPPRGQVVILIPGADPATQQVPLLAESHAAAGRHAWFVDGSWLGALAPEETAWWTPSPGRHEIVVVDEAGRAARRLLEVREAVN